MSKLYLSVGSLLTLTPDEDPEGYEDERSRLADMTAWLADEGVDVDLLSDPGQHVWQGEIEEFAHIYHLRVLAAHLGAGRDIAALKVDRLPRTDRPDALLARIWEGNAASPYDHLIRHNLTDGFYLPVDFESPIWAQGEDDGDEESVVCFGSSVALDRELTRLDAALAVNQLSAQHPAYVALRVLAAAARNRVAHRLPVSIWE
jgi:hypothetical protein